MSLVERIFSATKHDTRENSTAVEAALRKGIATMHAAYVNTITLSVQEATPRSDVAGRWIEMGKETQYYPFTTLDAIEQDMIRTEKTYTRTALVQADVDGMRTYAEAGVEVAHRTRLGHALLPKMKPESELNYVTSVGIHPASNLRAFAREAAQAGWTPELIAQRVQEGIKEYRAKTTELCTAGGVYTALEAMDARTYAPQEEIFTAMRANINTAKK
jgi:hypothetical protein